MFIKRKRKRENPQSKIGGKQKKKKNSLSKIGRKQKKNIQKGRWTRQCLNDVQNCHKQKSQKEHQIYNFILEHKKENPKISDHY